MNTDKELFKEIYQENFKYVYAFVYARLPGNQDSVEDLVQNVFTAAFNSMKKFRGKSSCRTWLCGIARHKITDFYRKEIGNYPIEYMDELDKGVCTALEEVIITQEVKENVVKALNKLQPLYRYAIVLKYVDNCSVKEISKIIEKTPKAVDGILQRGKLKFKNEFVKLEGGNIDD
ncbi:MAG: RNA polymerase sigma factor [Solirubrobacterales bacterium]